MLQEWMLNARVEILRRIEAAGELANEALLAGQYQTSIDQKAAAVMKQKSGAIPTL